MINLQAMLLDKHCKNPMDPLLFIRINNLIKGKKINSRTESEKEILKIGNRSLICSTYKIVTQ